jgi:hypothetical protein
MAGYRALQTRLDTPAIGTDGQGNGDEARAGYVGFRLGWARE